MSATNSWFTGLCEHCEYPVIVTQPNIDTNPSDDYRWYCSNPNCVNHDKNGNRIYVDFNTFEEKTPVMIAKERINDHDDK